MGTQLQSLSSISAQQGMSIEQNRKRTLVPISPHNGNAFHVQSAQSVLISWRKPKIFIKNL